jgi:hypothetical protein
MIEAKILKFKFLLLAIVALFSMNSIAADVLIGHAYYFGFYSGDKVKNFARPLFKKSEKGWGVFPNGKTIGNTPDALQRSRALFPAEIAWNIFDYDNSWIGEERVQNTEAPKWWITVGASPMQFDLEKIDKDHGVSVYNPGAGGDYDPSVDLILSTNKNVSFSKIKSKTVNNTKDFNRIFSEIKNIRHVANYAKKAGKKEAVIYSVDGVDTFVILNFTRPDGEMNDITSTVLVKDNDKWKFIFDSEKSGLGAPLSLKTAADFTGDGKSEYIFISSEFNHWGYALWQPGMSKPLVYVFLAH